MAPVESDVANSNRDPLLFFASKVILIDLCLMQVITSLDRASRALPPSQTTRARAEQRKKTVSTFGALAVASLLVLAYHGTMALVYSYDAWAQEHAETTPGALWDGWYAGDVDLNWKLGKWWQDVNLYKTYKEVALGTSKGLWWTEQLLVAQLAFSAFMGIEGHRRGISNWTIAALQGLTEFAGLSVAQCLFFILLLLTPVPSASSQHHARWTPHPALQVAPVVCASACIAYLPGLASNNLEWIAGVGCYLSQLLLAIGVRFVPRGWGKQHKDTHTAHQASATVYRLIAPLSIGFFLRSTFWAMLLNSGDTFRRRHNFVWNMHPVHERSTLSKLASAAGKILGTISEEPIISATGWDVVLAGVTICTWAAVRSLDVGEMLGSITPSFRAKASSEKHVAFEAGPETESKLSKEETAESQGSPAKRGRGRPRKNAAAASTQASPPGSGRSLRSRAAAHGSDSEDGYVPPAATAAEIADAEHGEEYDESVVEDAEAAALAWGLAVVGGLGVASAAVMGAELGSR